MNEDLTAGSCHLRVPLSQGMSWFSGDLGYDEKGRQAVNQICISPIMCALFSIGLILATPGYVFGADCNGNGIDDAQDIAEGTSTDCNQNGVPDECDVDPADPDGDGVVSEDCQPNGFPDECDLATFNFGFANLTIPSVEMIEAMAEHRTTTLETAMDKTLPDRFRFPPRPVIEVGDLNGASSKSMGATPEAGGLSVLDMSNGLTPTTLVNQLVSGEITISNIVLRGTSASSGTFTGGEEIIGFDSGLILSSGGVKSVIGPNTSDGTTTILNTPGDSNLNSLIPGYETYDSTVLEFDFECGTVQVIQFEYVFTSEEYNEYVGSPFNDVFGFFLNGQNIALVPGAGSTPVAINNVNCGNPYSSGPNCGYYRNNDLEDGGGSINTEMDGLTRVFVATGMVEPGVNHIKLAIADAGDQVLDSNVFIKADSFTCALPTGACCNTVNRLCLNDVLEEDCQGEDLLWTVGLTCDEVGCITLGESQDCDSNNVPDECQLDSDGDSIPDACDICAGGDDTLDEDEDSIPDDCDNCPTVVNPQQQDGNGNGIGSCCDASEPDADGDGFADLCDNCSLVTNVGQGDMDGDGVGNVCDNCQLVVNPAQTDTDNDGAGDLCDTDDDDDGVADDNDNCPLTINKDQNDTDGDGLGDACDTDCFTWDFEIGLVGGFEIDNDYGVGGGLWHLSTGRAADDGHSTAQSLYYGQGEGPDGGGDYNAGLTAGRVVSPEISLKFTDAPIVLSFAYFLETEQAPSLFDADVASVEVSTDGESFRRMASNDPNDGTPMLTDGSGVWVRGGVDLSGWAGSDIQVAFVFDTVDRYANQYEGFYVDDIQISGVWQEDADCDHNGAIDVEEIAAGTAADCNGNAIPDVCEPDSDFDGVIDECDACPDTRPGSPIDDDGCVLQVPGDFDGDIDVDADDFGQLQSCMTGPNVPQNDPACEGTDLDEDGDVDQSDFGLFQGCLSGPGEFGDPDCLP